MTRLVLASSSPRRREILRSLGIRFHLRAVDIPETPRGGEPPEETVARLASEKALAGASPPPAGVASPQGLPLELILGADTVVLVDQDLLGKPRDAEDAARMLARLSGRPHEVLTGLALLDPASGRIEAKVCRTVVRFASLTRREIADYVSTGEPMDKAGAYGIQERGGWFVESIEGSYSNVVGLPIETLRELLARFGVGPSDLAGA